ncbi:ovocalyxin-32-like [Python bivittatus]|uniref:Ovocalyxin-32-like n=1 Tax=Python bivittatus TaxID=176946 RepID=A0A9F2R0Y4_PYTBI|nr:ovocalyxin-32-like [Python bivittatus]
MAVVLLLLPALCWARESYGRDLLQPKFAWHEQLLPPSRGQSVVSDSQAARVARTVVQYLNYNQGSPSFLRTLVHVRKVSAKSIPGVGRKYSLQFSTKHIQTRQNLGRCLATVFYRKDKPKPMIQVSCTDNKDADQRRKEDYELYVKIKDTSFPAELENLANIGSSYIAWEKSSENVGYVMSEIKDMKKWESDNALEFDYTVLIDSDVSEGFSQTLSCHMRITWNLELPIKVKYDCTSEDTSVESSDGSGDFSGTSAEFFTESNF